MKNGLKVLALVGFLAANLVVAGPVEVRTQFRPRIAPERIKVEVPTMAALRERVAQDASVHLNVLKPMMTDGGSNNGAVVFEPGKIKAETTEAFRKYELAHKELMDEMAKYPEGKEPKPGSPEWTTLMAKFEARELALDAFVNKGKSEGFISVKKNGHWDFAAQVKVATQGGSGNTGGTGNTGNHTAEAAARATSETSRPDPGTRYEAVMKDLPSTFQGRSSIEKAIQDVYGDKAVDAATKKGGADAAALLKEKAVLVTGKAADILARLEAMGNKLKFQGDRVRELLETIIRSEAGPAEMEALLQMVTKFDEDAGAGLSRMVALDLALRRGGLPKEKQGEYMSHWLSAGEDFRALISPDINKSTPAREAAVLSSLAQAAREFWIKEGRLPKTDEEINGLFRTAANKEGAKKMRLTAKDFESHRDKVKLAEEKLAKAKEGKGEDVALEHAVCSADCKGPFKCRGG